ncbi:alanine racemase [Desulfitibacter alkalitolerans]|uniref:alanine racemase n=1 Tax=Desulfitibacter alkalitolerans TaxID=264641 RepID=UPI0004802286|nr:alanine racemase [Desulfitibacter alkalitolerans]
MYKYKLPDEVSAWIEVDGDALLNNLKRIRQIVGTAKILAVVKANAYGLGQNEVARIFQGAGVDCFGVTNLSEAINLRNGGITSPVVLFAPLAAGQLSLALDYNLIPSISSITQLQELQQAAAARQDKVKIHIELETGMGRTGLWLTDILPFIEELAACPNIDVDGIYTHLARAGADKDFSEKQFTAFKEGIKLFQSKGIVIPNRHIVNSTGVINFPHMHLDMVRVGTLLYGQVPMGAKLEGIIDPWAAKAKIINLRNVPANWPIGYGSEYITREKSLIGIVPVGFADGFNVSPKIKPKGFIDLIKIIVKEVLAYYGIGPQALGVQFQTKSYPVVGRIGMQLTMVDFTGSNIKEGDIVSVALRRINTPQHLPRVYLKDGQPYKIIFAEREINLLEKGEM